ncbi:MAG: YraN family protein [Saprospiraceae bacterium]|nr:YraN family protein [Pyrinomonadaceae bacterium]
MSETISILRSDTDSLYRSTRETGREGEDLAARSIVEKGGRLVLGNFKVPIGRNSKGVQVSGEIDLVVIDSDTLCFVEVKTRRSSGFGGPLAAVDLRKQRQITRTARIYRNIFRVRNVKYRFDVITVLLEKNREPEIEWVKGFWNEAKFRKKAWSGDI